MHSIISCESQYNYKIQSHHTYHSGNVPVGYSVGDREESYGLVQIHVPVHDVTIAAEKARLSLFFTKSIVDRITQAYRELSNLR